MQRLLGGDGIGQCHNGRRGSRWGLMVPTEGEEGKPFGNLRRGGGGGGVYSES